MYCETCFAKYFCPEIWQNFTRLLRLTKFRIIVSNSIITMDGCMEDVSTIYWTKIDKRQNFAAWIGRKKEQYSKIYIRYFAYREMKDFCITELLIVAVQFPTSPFKPMRYTGIPLPLRPVYQIKSEVFR